MRAWMVCAVVAVVGCAGKSATAPEASEQSSGHEQEVATTEAPAASAAAEEDPDRFESVTAGFAVRKPEQWHFANLDQIAENRAQVRLNDEELQQAIQNHGRAPLVAMMKHEEPYPELNPSVQVMMRPLGQLKALPPAKLLEASVSAIARAVGDFQLIEPIAETQLSGLPAASLRAQYVVATQDGAQFATLTRMWLAVRGEFMFLVSMSGPPDGEDVSEAEFAAVLDSIQIDA